MESSKKQNVIIILLVFIIILLLFLIGFLFIGNNKFNDNKIDDVVNNQTSIEEDINDNEVIYPDWMQHILDSDIQSITLVRTIISTTPGEDDYYKKVNLTKENLETIFLKLRDYGLIKRYTTGMGIADGNELTISYKYNDKTYEIIISNGYIFEQSADKKLVDLLEKSNYTVENNDNNIVGYVFKFDDSYSGSIYDSYFQN